MVIKTILWLFWHAVYVFRPVPKSLEAFLIREWRLQPPWQRFKPYIYHNEEGSQWEVRWKDSQTFTRLQDLRVEAHVDTETGEIVGVTLWDEVLRADS